MSAMPNDIPLGQQSQYVSTYTPSLLFSMAREETRNGLGIREDALPFRGVDTWTCYEFSWLTPSGKPDVAALRIQAPCTSKCVVESKSMKLYLNSFAQTTFSGRQEVRRTLTSDLSLGFRTAVLVEMLDLDQLPVSDGHFPGVCLDELDVRISQYDCDPTLLGLDDSDVHVRETLYTNLFRTICPVTAQPDWASVMVQYAGRPINEEGLLKYLISFRNHAGFHEEAIERIFVDVRNVCAPDQLTVYGRFLRRGGIDISPFRSTSEDAGADLRLPHQ